MASSINASTTAGVVTTADTSGVLNIQTAGTTALTVDTTANVGIGTASPSTKLQVVGTVTAGASGSISLYDANLRQTGASTPLSIGTAGAGYIQFYNNDANTMQISATGRVTTLNTISVGNATPSTSGAGITFPATQSASTDANTLDDYEEGTWTPVDASGASLSFSSAGGFYTKIGRQVICFFYVTYPATANASATAIGGLPFTTGNNVAGGVFTGAVAYNNYGSMQLVGPSSVTSFNLSTPTGSDITNANMSSKTVRGSFLYFVA